MSNRSFYKTHVGPSGTAGEQEATWCKICGYLDLDGHAPDCIVPLAEHCMEVVHEWDETSKKARDGLREIEKRLRGSFDASP